MSPDGDPSNYRDDSSHGDSSSIFFTERVRGAQSEIQALIALAQRHGITINLAGAKVIQVCAGYGASTHALSELGVSPEHIINVDSDPLIAVKNPNTVTQEVSGYLNSDAFVQSQPDVIIGTWAPWTVVRDVIEYKINHPADQTVGLFTLCQLQEGVDDTSRIDDIGLLRNWLKESNVGSSNVVAILSDHEYTSFSEVYLVLVFNKPNQRT